MDIDELAGMIDYLIVFFLNKERTAAEEAPRKLLRISIKEYILPGIIN